MDPTIEDLVEQAEEMLDLAEDAVSFFCSEQGVSGQRAWALLRSLSEFKCSEFPSY